MNKLTRRQFHSLLGNIGYIIGFEQTGKLEDTEEDLQQMAKDEIEELKKQGRW